MRSDMRSLNYDNILEYFKFESLTLYNEATCVSVLKHRKIKKSNKAKLVELILP